MPCVAVDESIRVKAEPSARRNTSWWAIQYALVEKSPAELKVRFDDQIGDDDQRTIDEARRQENQGLDPILVHVRTRARGLASFGPTASMAAPQSTRACADLR